MNDSIILKNNPFVAPADGRCIINDLPAELLSQIFVIGAECHCEESKGDGDDDSYTDSLSELDSDTDGMDQYDLQLGKIALSKRDVALKSEKPRSSFHFRMDSAEATAAERLRSSDRKSVV